MNPSFDPPKIIEVLIPDKGAFPNNPRLPLLIYKQSLPTHDPKEITKIFQKNAWIRSWTNGIYSFHHFHSNTHEVLGVARGLCTVQIGGEEGSVFEIEKGDVLIIPAGVSHKNLKSTPDFVCIGAYPLDIEYDMHFGKAEERLIVDQNIDKVPLPQYDPVYGLTGPLFSYWKP